MSSNSTILITGGNRGIGRGLVGAYLARDKTTVIAAVRDPSRANLSSLPKGTGSTLIVVKIDSGVESDPSDAVKELQEKFGITALDVVIANAAIAAIMPVVVDAGASDMAEHYKINVIAPVLLFQATLPLLNKAATPKFVTISSSAGSIGDMAVRPYPNAVYGTTKAALNYVTCKIHFEHESIIAFPVDPGWVQTDMGNFGAVFFGVPGGLAEITTEKSVEGLTAVIDSATREKHSGKFMVYDGKETAW